MTAKKSTSDIPGYSVLDHLPEGFQLIDRDWRYRYVNETVARQGNSTKEALLGKTVMEQYPGIENTELFGVLRKCMQHHVAERMESAFTYPDGSKAWFEFRIEPVPQGIFILSINITARKQEEEALRSHNGALEQRVCNHTAELDQMNNDMADSTRFAARMQHARMPVKTEIFKSLPQSFILYRPKAALSRSFYSFNKRSNAVCLTIAACTGPEVPGGLLSMLCTDRLNAFMTTHTHVPEIFTRLNHEMSDVIQQRTGAETTLSGVDVACCLIDPMQGSLQFCGANRSLWLSRQGSRHVEEFRGAPGALGTIAGGNRFFETHDLKLDRGDTFYIFSDGYANMRSGSSGQILTTKRFKDLLWSIQHKSMGEQEKYLDSFAEKWREGAEQLEDILVIGVRV